MARHVPTLPSLAAIVKYLTWRTDGHFASLLFVIVSCTYDSAINACFVFPLSPSFLLLKTIHASTSCIVPCRTHSSDYKSMLDAETRVHERQSATANWRASFGTRRSIKRETG